MLIAGEVSGDMHGARLVKELRRKNSALQFIGVGGEHMRAEGVRLIHHVHDLAVLGAVEVIRHYPKIRAIFYELLAVAKEKRPEVVILIDYPGFNIRFAKQLKKYDIPVIYYISPQIWAWGQHRRKVIALCVDKMLVFFEFEKQFYHDTGLDVEFVGHPIADTLKTDLTREEFYKKNDISLSTPVIGLLPGSRKNEIIKILPVILESAKKIRDVKSDVQFILPVGSVVPKALLMSIIDKTHMSNLQGIKVIEGQVHETMAYSDMVLIASGTATLETAWFGTPMIIIYKVSFITAVLARMVIKIPYIGLVNVVAGKKIIPEFLQTDAKPDKIAQCALEYLTDKKLLAIKRQELSVIKEKLGKPDAVARAAQAIMRFLQK